MTKTPTPPLARPEPLTSEAQPRAAVGVSTNPGILEIGSRAPLRFVRMDFDYQTAKTNAIQMYLPPNSVVLEYRVDVTTPFSDPTAQLQFYTAGVDDVPVTLLFSADLQAGSRSNVITVQPNPDGHCVLAIVPLAGSTAGKGIFQIAFTSKMSWLLRGPNAL
jgi:hypothetical protein